MIAFRRAGGLPPSLLTASWSVPRFFSTETPVSAPKWASSFPEMIKQATGILHQSGIPNAASEVRAIVAHALGVKKETLVSMPPSVTEDQRDLVETLVTYRSRREPLAYILREKEFYSRKFLVTNDVLVPRPETELIVDSVLKHISPHASGISILDLGTGSGVLLLTLLAEIPRATMGLGIDNSKKACQVAFTNAENLGVSSRAVIAQAHWSELMSPDDFPGGQKPPWAGQQYDVVVSNPPYVPSEVLSDEKATAAELGFEPRRALDGGPEGLRAYEELSFVLPLVLRPGPYSRAFLELGAGQREAVQEIMAEAGLEVVEVAKDLAGIERCMVLRHKQN